MKNLNMQQMIEHSKNYKPARSYRHRLNMYLIRFVKQNGERFPLSRMSPIPCFINNDEDGNIVFEWKNGERRLLLTIGAEGNTYLKSWGTNIYTEMEDGEINGGNILQVWNWLNKNPRGKG